MKVVATADLHFEVARSREPAERLAAELADTDAEVLIIAGDVFACDPNGLRRSLDRFAGFRGRRLLVAGNHDLWTLHGDSQTVYEQMGGIAAEAGFHLLDAAPTMIDGVAFVGNVGWYDLSYRRPHLGIPERFYRAKVSPGAAAVLAEHRGLLSDKHAERPSERSMEIRCRWRDGTRVRWQWTDEQFLERCLERLERDLTQVEAHARAIVAVSHFVPFAELVADDGRDKYDFAAAYLGSPRLGEVLRRHPKVTHAFCGHSHRPGRVQFGGLTCINIGSTYVEKRAVEVQL